MISLCCPDGPWSDRVTALNRSNFPYCAVSEMAVSSSFISSFKQSVISLLFDLNGLIAGAIVVGNLGLVAATPWTIVIYPAIISMRGTIGGIFCGHYSTSLHLGNMKPGIRDNTEAFYTLLSSIFVLNLISCIGLWAAALPFLYLSGFEFLPPLMLLLTTTGLSFLIIAPISTMIISFGYRRGLDPDVLAYPVESTIADLLITSCYVISLYFYFNFGVTAFFTIAVFDSLLFIVGMIFVVTKRRSSYFVKTVKESLLALALCSIIVNVTGLILLNVSTAIEGAKEIFNVYPALIDTVGDVGSIVGSILTTKLALGSLKASFRNFRAILPEIGGAWAGSAVMFVLFSLIASIFYHPMDLFAFLKFTAFLLTINVLACGAIVVVSVSTAILTYTRGLDPDTFVIPIESSFADSMTTASVLVALAMMSGL